VKRILSIVFSSFALMNSSLALSADFARPAQPMAVFIEADWCANCKILKPKLRDAFKGLEHKIDLVNIDVTDDKRFFESQQIVYRLGVPKLLKGSISVGWVALFDRRGNEVGKLMQDMSEEVFGRPCKILPLINSQRGWEIYFHEHGIVHCFCSLKEVLCIEFPQVLTLECP